MKRHGGNSYPKLGMKTSTLLGIIITLAFIAFSLAHLMEENHEYDRRDREEARAVKQAEDTHAARVALEAILSKLP